MGHIVVVILVCTLLAALAVANGAKRGGLERRLHFSHGKGGFLGSFDSRDESSDIDFNKQISGFENRSGRTRGIGHSAGLTRSRQNIGHGSGLGGIGHGTGFRGAAHGGGLRNKDHSLGFGIGGTDHSISPIDNHAGALGIGASINIGSHGADIGGELSAGKDVVIDSTGGLVRHTVIDGGFVGDDFDETKYEGDIDFSKHTIISDSYTHPDGSAINDSELAKYGVKAQVSTAPHDTIIEDIDGGKSEGVSGIGHKSHTRGSFIGNKQVSGFESSLGSGKLSDKHVTSTSVGKHPGALFGHGVSGFNVDSGFGGGVSGANPHSGFKGTSGTNISGGKFGSGISVGKFGSGTSAGKFGLGSNRSKFNSGKFGSSITNNKFGVGSASSDKFGGNFDSGKFTSAAHGSTFSGVPISGKFSSPINSGKFSPGGNDGFKGIPKTNKHSSSFSRFNPHKHASSGIRQHSGFGGGFSSGFSSSKSSRPSSFGSSPFVGGFKNGPQIVRGKGIKIHSSGHGQSHAPVHGGFSGQKAEAVVVHGEIGGGDFNHYGRLTSSDYNSGNFEGFATGKPSIYGGIIDSDVLTGFSNDEFGKGFADFDDHIDAGGFGSNFGNDFGKHLNDFKNDVGATAFSGGSLGIFSNEKSYRGFGGGFGSTKVPRKFGGAISTGFTSSNIGGGLGSGSKLSGHGGGHGRFGRTSKSSGLYVEHRPDNPYGGSRQNVHKG